MMIQCICVRVYVNEIKKKTEAYVQLHCAIKCSHRIFSLKNRQMGTKERKCETAKELFGILPTV